MSAWRKYLELWAVLCVLNATLAKPMFANDTDSHYPLRITVLKAETHALSGEAQAGGGCALVSYSPDCYGSAAPPVENILLVRDADGRSYRISCTAESRWSKCSSLPVGQTFQARKEKHGFTILYQDAGGKERKQFYQLLAALPAPKPGAATDSQPQATVPQPNSSAPPPAPPTRPVQEAFSEKVRCNFSSIPSGAEITLDGRYMGNTPSEIDLLPGTYSVIFSKRGFSQWKREVTVLRGSEWNITAILQKEQ